ncbi:exported hypothetical protein [Agrobacterium tomkonis CFBP 6623]|uniref:Uncharacterized protein n=1 Tax=Agrobacterium tomkonis CFBP 6623 TaxID=1183432 RepID=A0A1S7REQ1_9HYPH|nr:exported hypothetical protein [Agrobacterium tomkonis CFBP 6623]
MLKDAWAFSACISAGFVLLLEVPSIRALTKDAPPECRFSSEQSLDGEVTLLQEEDNP